MKKNIYKNKIVHFPFPKQFSHSTNTKSLRNLVLKNEFDKKVQTIDSNSSVKDRIQKNMVDCIDAKKSILSDLAKIEPAQKAVEKISNNETPLKKEFTAYSQLKNQYEEHLADDSDLSSESESNSYEFPKQTQHEKLADLNTYLKSEYKSSVSSLKIYKKQLFRLGSEVSVETSKRKMEETSDQDSSKKNRQSVHDFIENLPNDYNPLEDIGSD